MDREGAATSPLDTMAAEPPDDQPPMKRPVRLRRLGQVFGKKFGNSLDWYLGKEQTYKDAEEFAVPRRDDANSQAMSHLSLSDSDDETEREQIVEYQGVRFRSNAVQDVPWFRSYLAQRQAKSIPYETEDEEPYHFQERERTESEVEMLNKERLFADPNDISDSVAETTNSTVDPEENLAKLLYELSDSGDDDESCNNSVKRAPPKTIFQRFYDSNQDFDYDPNLSVTHSRDALLSSIEENRVTIVVGPTGTGKTTQIPLFVLDAFAKDDRMCNMVVTQPRRLAAFTNAQRVASLRKDKKGRRWKLGHLVGYHVGMSRVASRVTCLTFCTTAIFLKIAASQLNLNRFTHLFLDEVHERDQDTDLSLMLVKKMMQENSPDVKLIIMSATMNLEKIQKYFSDADASLTPNVIKLSSHYNFKIDDYSLDELCPNRKKPAFKLEEPLLHKEMFKLAIELIAGLQYRYGPPLDPYKDLRGKFEEADTPGAVLMFLPGMSDIQDFDAALRKEADDHGYNWEVLALHSQLSKESQERVMTIPAPHVRRIILSTNIAESSVTIPYIVYVIDFGLTKRLIVDTTLDIPRLALQWTSQANIKQRKGRIGRVKPGVYHCMLTADFRRELLEHELPDITVSPIHHSILHVKVLNLPRAWKPHDLFSLLLDPPSKKKVDVGILQLKEAGALGLRMDGRICADNGELTQIGRILERLPVSPNLGRLLIFSYVFGVLEDGISLAAGLSIHSIFLASGNSGGALRDWLEKRVRYNADAGCDCLTILEAYQKFTLACQNSLFDYYSVKKEDWCADNLLSYARIKEMYCLRSELQMRLESMGMYHQQLPQLPDPKLRADILRIVVAAAFYPSYFVQEALDSRTTSLTIPYGDPQLTLAFTHLPGHDGPIYEEQLRRIVDPFQMGIDEIPPEIIYTTDSINDKAYVTFSRHTVSCAYGVARGVHLALRANRGFGPKPKLFIMSPSEQYRAQIAEHITAWNRSGIVDSLFLARTNFRRDNPIVIPTACGVPLGLSRLKVAVVSIIAVDRIFIRFDDHNKEFVRMHDELQTLKQNQPPMLSTIMPGDYALAVNPETGIVHRIQVVSVLISAEVFKVFSIDGGEYFEAHTDHIRCIPQSSAPNDFAWYLANKPAFAFEFRFAKIHIREFLSQEVMTFLKSGVLVPTHVSESVHLEVYSVLGSVVHGFLLINHTATGCTEINLNEELVTLGFACSANESYLSHSSHENPNGHLQYGPSKKYVDVPPGSSQNILKTDTVHGPYSPISPKFTSLVQQLQSCVNHRVLDGRPEMGEISQRVMVAASVERSEKSEGNLVLRNSTLLPRQPGLLAILVALFAPCVQLKTNKTISTEGFVGAIAGVGFVPSRDGKRALSLYPDHDLRAQFDVVLTPSDVDGIEGLRFMINHTVKDIDVERRQRTTQRELSDISILQKNCSKLLFDILTRPRKPCPGFSTRLYSVNYAWSLKDQPLQSHSNSDLMLQPLYLAALSGDTGCLLQKDRLNERNLELHREAIRSFTHGDQAKLSDLVNLECFLCQILLPRRHDVSVHIHSKQHREKELNNLLCV